MHRPSVLEKKECCASFPRRLQAHQRRGHQEGVSLGIGQELDDANQGIPRRLTCAAWQWAHLGSTPDEQALPDADADEGGASNYLKFLVGTNPTSAGNAWKLGIIRTGEQVEVDFVPSGTQNYWDSWTRKNRAGSVGTGRTYSDRGKAPGTVARRVNPDPKRRLESRE